MIDAKIRSEEKFVKLSIAYMGKDEGKLVCSTIDSIVAKHALKPEMYTCSISNGREVVVIEYHNDPDREAGAIFEEIIKTLKIDKCN